MARINDITSKQSELGLAAYSKQFQDSKSYQDAIKKQEIGAQRQEKADEKAVERIEKAKEKEVELIEKKKEKQSDRWFQAKLLIIGAVVGGLVMKLFDIFFK
ncbi:MAG: hypothetical protein JWP94_3306 [Mucilaginibacter sp.]|nr:hypothetical protein [Mucilaginibacter sp.]